jgi:hypothetical protein
MLTKRGALKTVEELQNIVQHKANMVFNANSLHV